MQNKKRRLEMQNLMTFFVLLIRNEPVIIKWNRCVRSESERGRIKKKYN